MTSYRMPREQDPVRPEATASVELTVDGERVRALPGQTVAAVLLELGRTTWRTTRGGGRPRGLFCGIGVCFDCLVVVDGVPDVRACQRVVADGNQIRTQHGAELPEVER